MYAHRYSTETDYQVVEHCTGFDRILLPGDNQTDYLSWVAGGGIPTIEANGRFLSVVDNQLVVDPNKDAILAAEEVARAEAPIKAALREIDISSIRSLREYVATQEDAPQYLKDYESAAIVERAKLSIEE